MGGDVSVPLSDWERAKVDGCVPTGLVGVAVQVLF